MYIQPFNPPAPKVPKHGSLAARYEWTHLSVWYSFSGGGIVEQSSATANSCASEHGVSVYSAKKCTGLWSFALFADRPNIVQMHRFGPTWPQHGLHLGSTSANKAPTSQLGHTRLQLRRNLAPRWRNLAPEFGPIWEQPRSKLGSTWLQNWHMAGPIRNRQNTPRLHQYFTRFFGIDDASC